MAIRERRPFAHKSVEMGSVHVVKTELANRVEPLLVGNDKDNIGTIVAHGKPAMECWEQGIYRHRPA